MKIALADDHALFRAGLSSALKEAFGKEAQVLEAADRDGLADILRSEEEIALSICDLRMPGMDGFDCIADLAAINPAVPLVVVSASEEPEDACNAIKQGAKAYIFKSDSFEVVQHALELVLAGGTYAPVEALLSTGAQRRPCAPMPKLSRRQQMIFERLADGKSNKVIARELGIAEGTVKAQLRTVFRKLGVTNRVQAALVAAQVLDSASAANEAAAAPDVVAANDEEDKIYPFPNQV